MQMLFFIPALAMAAMSVSAQQCQPTTATPPAEDCIYPQGCPTDIYPYNGAFDVQTYSPLYDKVLENDSENENVKCACFTFFPFGYAPYNVYFATRYVTFNDGTEQVRTYLFAPVDRELGVYRAQGLSQNTTSGCDTCVFNDYILEQPSSDSFVLARCYLFGDCMCGHGGSSYLAVSSSPSISDELYEQIVYQYNFADPIRTADDGQCKCVVSINNTYALNYDRVPCPNRVHL